MKVFKILLLIIILITFFIFIKKTDKDYREIEINEIVFNAKIADNPLEWSKGLGGAQYLEEKEGMLFIFPNIEKRTFHMNNMNFPLDLLWIKDNIIVGLEKNMLVDNGLKKYTSPEEINMVLELRAGSIDEYNLNINNIINIKKND